MRACLFFVVAVMVLVVRAHPPVTFSMLLDDVTSGNPNTDINVPYNLTFFIYDLLNNDLKVNFSQLVPLHDRYLHVMLVSGDLETVYHLHPEDYETRDQMLQHDDSYFVTVSFPKRGKWYIALSFMANVTGGLREGAAQYEFVVNGTVDFNNQYDYTKGNSFRTYDIGADQVFDQPVVISENTKSVGGYTVSVNFSPNSTGIEGYKCQPFYISVLGPDGYPATNFIPYLDAPLHIIFAADEDTVYHGHGMDLNYLAPNLELVKYYAMMAGRHDMSTMNVTEGATMMNAMMLGINNMGVLNCTSDLGRVMREYHMDPYEPMLPTSNYTFGPNFLGIFDFPNFGNWRMFLYFRVQEGNVTKLLVPHFSIRTPSNETTTATTTSSTSTTDGTNDNAAYHLSSSFYYLLSFVLACLCIAGL